MKINRKQPRKKKFAYYGCGNDCWICNFKMRIQKFKENKNKYLIKEFKNES
jgi:hypothetical protein